MRRGKSIKPAVAVAGGHNTISLNAHYTVQNVFAGNAEKDDVPAFRFFNRHGGAGAYANGIPSRAEKREHAVPRHTKTHSSPCKKFFSYN